MKKKVKTYSKKLEIFFPARLARWIAEEFYEKKDFKSNDDNWEERVKYPNH